MKIDVEETPTEQAASDASQPVEAMPALPLGPVKSIGLERERF